ncbi:hypothetical protein B0J11DRAFT_550421 [Dendryphion nanum]|uniref:FAD-binding domain-containing protein n=1 Tax=Dendryphion nanum TaxID=256645 RepID=A0A9P9IKM3_9PLEO|nr:hypothetical protein B0J11DRAFT_550421 [Dendryphion nanum]
MFEPIFCDLCHPLHHVLPNPPPSSNNDPALPILIAGAGCTGLFLSVLLSQYPIQQRIIIIDPYPPTPGSAKAMAHQPIIFPLFAAAGLMPDLAALGSFSKGLCFRTSVANGSKVIAGKQFGEGEKAQLLLPQWKFQRLLLEKVGLDEEGRARGDAGGDEGGRKVEARFGWRVMGFDEVDGRVDVMIENADGKRETVSACYLLGADGGKSQVRRLTGVPLVGETLQAQLVATDIRFDFHAHEFFDANFIIDPEDYGLIGRIDEEGLWRLSYGVAMDTSEEEVREKVHQKLEKMLPGGGKGVNGERMYELVSVAPYKMQQRAAETFWREGGRVGLLGDAAHLTNAYAGLGLGAGIADAGALAPVLARILLGQAEDPEKLLVSWAKERREKFVAVVDKPSRMAYARVKTKVDTEEEIDALLSRDPMMGALKKGLPMKPPSLLTVVEELAGW